MPKIIRYSINVGNYDPVEPNGLMVLKDYNLFRNGARNSRIYKQLIHKYIDCDVSVYYDANQLPIEISDKKIIQDYLKDADMCVVKSKKTIYREIELALGRINNEQERDILIKQGEHYRKLGIPENTPVYGYQPLIRRHTPKVNQFMEAWWAEMCVWSYRDQVSFPKVLLDYPDIKIKAVSLHKLSKKISRHGRYIFPKIETT